MTCPDSDPDFEDDDGAEAPDFNIADADVDALRTRQAFLRWSLPGRLREALRDGFYRPRTWAADAVQLAYIDKLLGEAPDVAGDDLLRRPSNAPDAVAAVDGFLHIAKGNGGIAFFGTFGHGDIERALAALRPVVRRLEWPDETAGPVLTWCGNVTCRGKVLLRNPAGAEVVTCPFCWTKRAYWPGPKIKDAYNMAAPAADVKLTEAPGDPVLQPDPSPVARQMQHAMDALRYGTGFALTNPRDIIKFSPD